MPEKKQANHFLTKSRFDLRAQIKTRGMTRLPKTLVAVYDGKHAQRLRHRGSIEFRLRNRQTIAPKGITTPQQSSMDVLFAVATTWDTKRVYDAK